jgi:hypothetical protein
MPGHPKKRARRAAAAAAGKPPPVKAKGKGGGRGLVAELREDIAANKEPADYETWERGLSHAEKMVEQICEYMMNGQWLGGASVIEVGRKNDLSPETVRRYAAEANRLLRDRLRRDPELGEGARFEVLQNFRVIRALAMSQKDAGGLSVALNANRALGFYLGVEPVKRLEVADVTPDELEGWSDQELEDFAKSGQRPRRALRAVARELTNGELSNGNGANGNGHDGELEDEADDELH